MELFNDQERSDALIELGTVENMTLSIGVKKLLMVIEMARQDVDKVNKFVNTIVGLCKAANERDDDRF
jgi:vesicle-fusing ATPase